LQEESGRAVSFPNLKAQIVVRSAQLAGCFGR